jgi:hypothetical protein
MGEGRRSVMDGPQGDKQPLNVKNGIWINEAFTLLGYCVAYVGTRLPTFRGNLSVMFESKQCKKNSFFDCLTVGTNHQPSPRNIAEERRPQLLRGGSPILSLTKCYTKTEACGLVIRDW